MNTSQKGPVAALFDMDGVILDTEEGYTQFWGAVGEQMLPDNPTFAADLKGSTLQKIVDRYFGGSSEVMEALQEGLEAFEAQMDYQYMPGALSFLQELHEAGVPTALVTSSNKAKMAHVLKQRPEFNRLFAKILQAEDFQHSKPHPDGYLKAAEALGVPIEECVVFEDSRSGLQAGVASGARVVGLASTLSRDEVAALTEVVIGDLSECSLADFRKL